MFKNLKKKIGDEGADLSSLSTVSSPGTLGSSTSSLRRSGSKASSLSHSRESLQSESFKTILTSPISETDSESQKKLDEPAPLPLHIESDSTHLFSSPLFDETNSVETADKQKSLTDWFAPQDDFGDFSSSSTLTPGNVLSMVEDTVSDSSPVLVPISPVSDIPPNYDSVGVSRPPCDHSSFSKEIAALKQQLSDKLEEGTTLQRRLSEQESDRANFRTELDRLKGVQTQNRQNEEKLKTANSKLAEVTRQLENEKSEKDSWKIAHDQAVQRLKEKTSHLQAAQKKTTDLDGKLVALNSAAVDQRKESDKLRDENSSLKSTMEILEKQVDKFITDMQLEKAAKEKATTELRNLLEENSAGKAVVVQLELQIRKLEDDLRQEKISKDSALAQSRRVSEFQETIKALEKHLIEVQQLNGEAYRKLQDAHAVEIEDLKGAIELKADVMEGMEKDLREKSATVRSLEATVIELESRLKTVEEDLESKEATLAVFRRRSAKDTEIKLRERDKQIASLEKQLAEISERANTVGVQDHTSNEYTKNVVLKFLSANGEERLQLIRPVSVLLQLTETEELWLREVIAWKQSWLPGPKPELPHIVPVHSHGNGIS